MFENVRHGNVQLRQAGAAVEWIGPGWADNAPGLVLIGCVFQGWIAGRTYRDEAGIIQTVPDDPIQGGRVVVGFASGPVADLGTRSDTQPNECPFMEWRPEATGDPYRSPEMMRTGLRIGTVTAMPPPRWIRQL